MLKFLPFLYLILFTIGLNAQNKTDSTFIYKKQSNILKAITIAQNQAKIHKENEDWVLYAKTLSNHAQIYIDVNDQSKAQEILFQGLSETENAKNKLASCILRFRIAASYIGIQDYKSSIKHYRAILAENQKLKIDSLDGNAYQGLYSAFYSSENASDSTFYYLQKTIDYAKKTKSPQAKYRALNNASVLYINKKKYHLAEKYLDSLVTFTAQLKDKKKLSFALINQAAFYITEEQNYKLAKTNYDRVFELNAIDLESPIMANYYYTYADILENLGDANGALKYMNLAFEVKDKTLNSEKERAIWELENKYQVNQIERSYAEREKKNQLIQQRKNKIIIIMLGVFVVCLILFYFFLQNIKLKQKNREQQLENSMQLKLLSATIDGRESERKKIAQVLHDQISALLSSASMQLSFVSNIVPDSAKGISKAREIIMQSHDAVRHLSHELSPVLLSKFGLGYALTDLCEKNSNEHIAFKCTIEKDPGRLDPDFELKVYNMVSELINNVIKHSKASNAEIKLYFTQNFIRIRVQDNGIGYDSQNKRLEGFGLTQVRARVINLNGSLGIESKPDFGTVVHITLPLSA